MTVEGGTERAATRRVLSPAELEAALRAIGAERYHHRHPFHQRLHGGRCSREEVRAWALNRYLYQAAIPRKDAFIIARAESAEVRRAWRQRLVDHDGGDPASEAGPGGVARWLALTDALGLDRETVASGRLALPATRFAVEAYVTFVRERSLLEAIASSLTELFSPAIIGERVSGMLAHYDFVSAQALAYFTARPDQARRDTAFALAYVQDHATTPATQEAVLGALRFKCDVLWAMLDALHAAYVSPGHVPPGAYVPGAGP